MKKTFTTIFAVFTVTTCLLAQVSYDDFVVTACTGEISTEFFHEGTQSYKTTGGGTANPELRITINTIPDWTTITAVSLWVYTTANWNNGQIAINASVPGWKAQAFSATPNTWVKISWDFSATPFDGGNSWGQFFVQYYNQSADLYYDQITFYNSEGTEVYVIDASDVSSSPTSISVNSDEDTILVGKAMPLSLTVEPANSGSSCDFSSSDTDIAFVDAFGVVNAIGPGTATITATSRLDAGVTNTKDITVIVPDDSNSLIYANFENGLGNFSSAWASWINNGSGPVPVVEVVDNPTVSAENNPTAKVLKISDLWQYGAVAFKAYNVNNISKIKFKVYSDTEIPDMRFELGLNNGYASTVNTEASVLPAAAWTEFTFNIPAIQSDARQFYIKISSPGSATAAYMIYVDYIRMIAGDNFIPVTSLAVEGAGGASVISTVNGTLQMEAKDFLPANATNKNARFIFPDLNDTLVARITSDGLLTALSNGTVTVRAIADLDGAYAEKEITMDLVIGISNLNESVKFSPNPVADVLKIRCPEIISEVGIYNVAGKLVRSVNVRAPEAEINFAGYKSGIYFIKVQTASGVYSHKIMKE